MVLPYEMLLLVVYSLSETLYLNYSIRLSYLLFFSSLFFFSPPTLFLVFQACCLCGIEEVNSKLSRVFNFILTESISLKCLIIFRTRYITFYYPYLRPISFFFFIFLFSQSVYFAILFTVCFSTYFPFC
jgi:hypothetical protein